MDLHPMQTPNTVLTDNLNGTLITYNGNEYSLQNDMGNFKLKNCKLKPGYLPIGTASYADTIYILSYNPIDDNVELGSYPAPVQISSSSDTGYKQLYSIVEAYLSSSSDRNTDIIIRHEEAKQLINKVVFDENQFRLKRGDEYALSFSQKNTSGFEEFVYSVISDSGIKQVFDPNDGWNAVTWDSPGKIQIENKIFEIDHCDSRVLSKFSGTDSCEIKILYELYIKDKSFIEKLNKEKDIFKDSSNDHIIIKCESNIDSEKIKFDTTSSIENWLDEYKKICTTVRCRIDTEDLDKSEEITIKLTPEFNSKVLLKNSDSEKGIVYNSTFVMDTFSAEITTDLEKMETAEIGTRIFRWDGNTLTADCEENDDYKIVYKINDLDWEEYTYDVDKTKGTINIPIDDLDENLHVISFGRRLKPELNPEGEPEFDYDIQFQTSYLFYYYDDMSYIPNITTDKWYDVDIEKIYKYKYENIEVTPEVSNKGQFYLYDEGGKEGQYYNYFNRFNLAKNKESGIFFPSVVKSDFFKTTKTSQFFDIAQDSEITVTINDKYDLDPNLVDVLLYDRNDAGATVKKEKLNNKVTFKDSKVWNKVRGEVSQLGDTFYFADNVWYYKLNTGDYNPLLYAITLDGTNNLTLDNKTHYWHDVAPNNYRAIRMSCIKIDDGLASGHGCKQMNFVRTPNHIDGMCQYISEFHKIIRTNLDNNWSLPKLNSNESGECSTEGYQGLVSTLDARTYYRDKAQRPCFQNESGSINIFPDWNRWREDTDGSYDERHVSVCQRFLTLPIYNTTSDNSEYPNMIKKDIFEKMTRSEDCETHTLGFNVKVKNSGIEMAGIGFACKGAPKLYVAWIPNWEELNPDEQKFQPHCQPQVKLSEIAKDSSLNGKVDLVLRIPEGLKQQKSNRLKLDSSIINNVFPEGLEEIVIKSIPIDYKWDPTLVKDYVEIIKNRCTDDWGKLTKHPIFKTFINAKSGVSDRIKNHPVAGLYPDIAGSTIDAFTGVTAFTPWNHFYVDGKGRPFIINLDAKEHICIYKNGRKKVFGYIPYVGGTWESR